MCGGSKSLRLDSQSVSNASPMKLAQKPRCTARFRSITRYPCAEFRHGSVLRILNLSDVKTSANPNVPSQSVGTLAGANAGQIINVSVSGPNSEVSGFVSGMGIAGVGAGGLLGQNSGLIASSSTAATVKRFSLATPQHAPASQVRRRGSGR